MPIRAIIFDNDGVLTHTESTFFVVNKTILTSLGIEYGEDDFIEHTFDTGLGSSGWLKKKGYEQNLIDDFSKKRDALHRKEIVKADTSEPNAMPVLKTLKNDYLLCIATNTRRDMFNLTHGQDEAYKLFDEVVCREDYNMTKPAPDAYLAALKKINLNAGEVIVVEDSPRGIVAAKEAGLKVIAITNPHFPTINTKQADFHIQSLTELPDLLTRL